MANLTYYQPLVVNNTFGFVSVADDSLIRIIAGTSTVNYYGTGFAYSAFGEVVGGVLLGTDYSDSAHGGLQYSITNLSVSASQAFSFVINGNADGFMALLLAGNDIVTGSAFDDVLLGLGGSDSITGGAGHDFLDGTADGAVDTLVGGTGDDLYQIDGGTTGALDILVEQPGQGTDTVGSEGSWTLSANFENLVLLGFGPANATGNGLDNVLEGNPGNNQIDGLAGNDTLDGDGGIDTLRGGAGNDRYRVANAGVTLIEVAGDGHDTVEASISLALPDHVEDLLLQGDVGLAGTGNSQPNRIEATGGADTLDGGAGADTLVGGLGDDAYTVDNLADLLVDTGGNDTVQVWVNGYVLSEGALENLVLLGSAISASGNNAANRLTGNSQANAINGGGGNDTLDGAGGADTLAGGSGDDLYRVGSSGVTLAELPGEGIDTVEAWVDHTLAPQVERLWLYGGAGLRGTGNDLANEIVGTTQGDTLDGGLGADTLTGGDGGDQYEVDHVGDVVVEAGATGTDWIFSRVSFDLTLTPAVENLTLRGPGDLTARGNDQPNRITGNDGNNLLTAVLGDTLSGGAGRDTLQGSWATDFLDGGTGADRMEGDLGFDIYVVDDAGDVVVEVPVNTSDRYDLVRSWISYTLPVYVEWLELQGIAPLDGWGTDAGNEMLTGNAADNHLSSGGGMNDDLYGMAGNDTLSDDGGYARMYGGPGDDTYVITGSLAWVVEADGEGMDTIRTVQGMTLPAFVENLVLVSGQSGTGNALANHIVGNAGGNFLDGKAGADTLEGGAGDDVYTVDSVADVVIEADGAGLDSVVCVNISFSLAGTGVERLYLDNGNSFANTNGTGNALDNLIRGTNGDNRIDGGQGADEMMGYLGNDTYVVDDAGDVVTEFAGQGTDTVLSALPATVLGADLENLTLLSAAETGTGNGLANVLRGNASDNRLRGGAGNDTLYGEGGRDTAVYSGLAASYTVTRGAGSATVSGADGVDVLTGIDVLSFDDTSLVLNAHQPAGQPVITADPVRPWVLQADTSVLADADGLGVFEYQWLRNGDPIASANAPEYALGLADEGAALILQVRYLDGAGTKETVMSATFGVDPALYAPLTLISSTPAPGSRTLAFDSNLIFRFSGPVVASPRVITLVDPNPYYWFDPAQGASVQISGNELTIDLLFDLEPASSYNLHFIEGAITSPTGVPYRSAPIRFTTQGVMSGLFGTYGDDRLAGDVDDDTLDPALGNDTLDGGAGEDTAVLPTFPSNFSLSAGASPGSASGSYRAGGGSFSLDLSSIELVRFGNSFETTMALEELTSGRAQDGLAKLTDLYLAFFGRAPDAGGLEYWQERLLEEGRDFATISADFAWSTEAQSLFPANADNQAFVRSVYLNCFGREPDEDGWLWWTAKLDALDPNDPQYLNNRGSFVGELILGAYAPTSGAEDRDLLTNRHEVALYYATLQRMPPYEQFDAAINDLLERVTGDAATRTGATAVLQHVFDHPVTLTGVMGDAALLASLWG